jgi:hypothetical protein
MLFCKHYVQCDISEDAFIAMVKQKIYDEEPFAVSRFGDGDVCFFGDGSPYNCSVKKRICQRWGYQYPQQYQQAKEILFDILRYTVEHLDMLGFRFDSPALEWGKKYFVFSDGIASKLGYSKGRQRIFYWSIMCGKNFGMFDAFKSLLGGKPIHIISPFVKALQQSQIDQLLETSVTYTQVVLGRSWHEYQENLSSLLNIQEKVVLCGVSNNKNIGPYLKKHLGCISLDMGAILGAWGGVEERGATKTRGMWHHLVIARGCGNISPPMNYFPPVPMSEMPDYTKDDITYASQSQLTRMSCSRIDT